MYIYTVYGWSLGCDNSTTKWKRRLNISTGSDFVKWKHILNDFTVKPIQKQEKQCTKVYFTSDIWQQMNPPPQRVSSLGTLGHQKHIYDRGLKFSTFVAWQSWVHFWCGWHTALEPVWLHASVVVLQRCPFGVLQRTTKSKEHDQAHPHHSGTQQTRCAAWLLCGDRLSKEIFFFDSTGTRQRRKKNPLIPRNKCIKIVCHQHREESRSRC